MATNLINLSQVMVSQINPWYLYLHAKEVRAIFTQTSRLYNRIKGTSFIWKMLQNRTMRIEIVDRQNIIRPGQYLWLRESKLRSVIRNMVRAIYQ